jgi:hypothetical protein
VAAGEDGGDKTNIVSITYQCERCGRLKSVSQKGERVQDPAPPCVCETSKEGD